MTFYKIHFSFSDMRAWIFSKGTFWGKSHPKAKTYPPPSPQASTHACPSLMTSSGVPDKNAPVGETLPATQTLPPSTSSSHICPPFYPLKKCLCLRFYSQHLKIILISHRSYSSFKAYLAEKHASIAVIIDFYPNFEKQRKWQYSYPPEAPRITSPSFSFPIACS